MELRSYLAILRRRWRIIAITAVVTLAVVGIGTLLMRPLYVASTTLRFSNAANLATDSVSSDSVMYVTRVMNTYSRLATTERVLDDVRGRLGMRQAPQVKVDLPANTDLMVISVQNEDPSVAAAAANAVADILVADIAQLESSPAASARETLGGQLSELQNELQQAPGATDATARGTLDLKQQQFARLSDQYERARLLETLRAESISVLEPARVPETPALPRRALNMAIALVVGLVGGTALAFVVENLDTRVYTTRHLEEVVEESILAALPVAPISRSQTFFQTNSPELEALRRVSTELFDPRHTASPRVVLVTSAVPEEGKSTVVANLGVLFATSGRTVAIVD
ncbi:MAG: hypothetical protein JOY61_07650, partial [Chloroflexi bacterium]|nr:hypothetical protein [Chloroflexota bacterium]